MLTLSFVIASWSGTSAQISGMKLWIPAIDGRLASSGPDHVNTCRGHLIERKVSILDRRRPLQMSDILRMDGVQRGVFGNVAFVVPNRSVPRLSRKKQRRPNWFIREANVRQSSPPRVRSGVSSDRCGAADDRHRS